VRSAVDVAATSQNRRGEAGEVLQRVELTLLGKPERGPGLEACNRGAIDAANVDQAGEVGGGELLVELLDLLGTRRKQIAVEATEITVDVLGFGDHLHSVDRHRMALDDVPRSLLAIELLEHMDPIVHRIGEMGGRAAGLASAERPIVNDDDVLAGLGERVRRRQAGDAGADDADVGADATRQLRERGYGKSALPD
jgi:hypothetical protein